MNKYRIEPANGQTPYEIEAESVDVSETTGAITFKAKGNIVARLMNVSFRQLPAASADSK